MDKLRPGISIGVGVGGTNIEIRKITAITGNQLTLDSALTKTHAAGEPVTVEFTQYRWYSDVDSGTVFWHDHVNGIDSWAHGLFGAHIIEPAGSTYRDPVTGNAVKSGTIVDISHHVRVGRCRPVRLVPRVHDLPPQRTTRAKRAHGRVGRWSERLQLRSGVRRGFDQPEGRTDR